MSRILMLAAVIKLAQAFGRRYWLPIPWLKQKETDSKERTLGSLGFCSAPSLSCAYEWILLFFKSQKKLKGELKLSDPTRNEHMRWWNTPWTLPAETRKSTLSVRRAA